MNTVDSHTSHVSFSFHLVTVMLMLMAFYEMNAKMLSLQADTGAKPSRQRSLKENREKSPQAALKQPPKGGKADPNPASTSSSKPGNGSLRPPGCPRSRKS